MTHNKKYAFVLLCVSVVLLYFVSARIGQISNTADGGVSHDTDVVSFDNINRAGPQQSAAPVPTESPKPEINTADWQYKLVDETHVLSSSFAPNVTEIGDGQYFDERAADALNEMLTAANDAGYTTCVRAGYRPYKTQAYIFFGKASQIAWDGTVSYADAEVLAREYVAYPGTSEHQLGLAADIMDKAETALDAEKAAQLPVLQWLRENCAEYGFILRYPEEKKDITGRYEPWHFRYVGVEAAKYIMDKEICLEEFLDLY